MSALYPVSRKITISLPEELVIFADQRALETNSSRSQVISLALEYIKTLEEERLAAEGYRFYAQEAEEFAAISASAVSPIGKLKPAKMNEVDKSIKFNLGLK